MYSNWISFINSLIIKFAIFAFIVFAVYFVTNLYAIDLKSIKKFFYNKLENTNSSSNVQSGRLMEFFHDSRNERCDSSRQECLIPVERMHQTLRSEQKADLLDDTDDQSFANSGKNVGRMGLLYMLLSQRCLE